VYARIPTPAPRHSAKLSKAGRQSDAPQSKREWGSPKASFSAVDYGQRAQDKKPKTLKRRQAKGAKKKQNETSNPDMTSFHFPVEDLSQAFSTFGVRPSPAKSGRKVRVSLYLRVCLFVCVCVYV
jgi:hypothetical protein